MMSATEGIRGFQFSRDIFFLSEVVVLASDGKLSFPENDIIIPLEVKAAFRLETLNPSSFNAEKHLPLPHHTYNAQLSLANTSQKESDHFGMTTETKKHHLPRTASETVEARRKVVAAGVLSRLSRHPHWQVFLAQDLLFLIVDLAGPSAELPISEALPIYRPRIWHFSQIYSKWFPPLPTGRMRLFTRHNLRSHTINYNPRESLYWIRPDQVPGLTVYSSGEAVLIVDGSMSTIDEPCFLDQVIDISAPKGVTTNIRVREGDILRRPTEEEKRIVFPLTFECMPFNPLTAKLSYPMHIHGRVDGMEERLRNAFWISVSTDDGLDYWHWKREGCLKSGSSETAEYTAGGTARRIPPDEMLWRRSQTDLCRDFLSGRVRIEELRVHPQFPPRIRPWYLVSWGLVKLSDLPPDPDNVDQALSLGYLEEAIPFIRRGDFKMETVGQKEWYKSISSFSLPALLLLEKYEKIDYSLLEPRYTTEDWIHYFVISGRISPFRLIEVFGDGVGPRVARRYCNCVSGLDRVGLIILLMTECIKKRDGKRWEALYKKVAGKDVNWRSWASNRSGECYSDGTLFIPRGWTLDCLWYLNEKNKKGWNGCITYLFPDDRGYIPRHPSLSDVLSRREDDLK